MDNKIEIFKNEQFGEVRTILEGEKVLFCAADVPLWFLRVETGLQQ